jgi:histone H4
MNQGEEPSVLSGGLTIMQKIIDNIVPSQGSKEASTPLSVQKDTPPVVPSSLTSDAAEEDKPYKTKKKSKKSKKHKQPRDKTSDLDDRMDYERDTKETLTGEGNEVPGVGEDVDFQGKEVNPEIAFLTDTEEASYTETNAEEQPPHTDNSNLRNAKNKNTSTKEKLHELAKRRRTVKRDNIEGITKPAIRRLARRGGVKRLGGGTYGEVRGCLKKFLESVLKDTITYSEHAHRKTVTRNDVVYALKRQGRTIYL